MNLDFIKSHQFRSIMEFSIPAIIAMVLTSFITVVDGFFVGNFVGAEGLSAVNLGIPIVYFFLGIGLMFSVGGFAISGIALGDGDFALCKKAFNQTVFSSFLFSFALSFVLWFCLEFLLEVLNATGKVYVYFMDYYKVMIFQMPLMIILSTLGMFVRGEGKPQCFMIATIINLVLNVIFDYVFTLHFDLETQGIALASVLSTLCSIGFLLCFFVREAKVYVFGRFEFSFSILRMTVLNGFSEFVGELSLCISLFAYNFVILNNFGVEALTAFSIVGYISYVFSMVVIGFGQGFTVLSSFCYGAKEYSLARNLRKITNYLVFFAGAFLFGLILVFSKSYSRFFVQNQVVQDMIGSGILIFGLSFLFVGINTISSFYFTSIGKAKESAIISSARGLVILLFLIFTLPFVWGLNGLWLVAPITEALTLIISLYYIKKDYFFSS